MDANESYLRQHEASQEAKQAAFEAREAILYLNKMAALTDTKPDITNSYRYSILQDVITDIADEKLFVPLARAIQGKDFALIGKLLSIMVIAQLGKESEWEAQK